MYRVLSIDEAVIVLANPDGHVKRIDRAYFSFDPKLGDRVDLFYDDNDDVIATRAKSADNSSGSRAIRSALLQGIFDLFTEVLTIHNEQVGNLRKIISQLFIAFFMVWALIGVVIVELVILIESVILLVYQGLLVASKKCYDAISRKLADRAERQRSRESDIPFEEAVYDSYYNGDEDSDDEGYIIDLDALELSADDRDKGIDPD